MLLLVTIESNRFIAEIISTVSNDLHQDLQPHELHFSIFEKHLLAISHSNHKFKITDNASVIKEDFKLTNSQYGTTIHCTQKVLHN